MKKNSTINCATHGQTTATYVCNHLLSNKNLGFNCGYIDSDPDEHWPDAWCNDCQHELDQAGEWNETSVAKADIQVICSSCYENVRTKHWHYDQKKISKHHNICQQLLEKKQHKFIQTFNIIKHQKWQYFEDKGLLLFSHDNEAQVEAQVSICGTLAEQRWLWAWANEQLTDHQKTASRKVRALGKRNNDLILSSATWVCNEQDCVKMVAIMSKQLKAIGWFKVPQKETTQYLIIHKAHWLKPQNTHWFSGFFKR